MIAKREKNPEASEKRIAVKSPHSDGFVLICPERMVRITKLVAIKMLAF